MSLKILFVVVLLISTITAIKNSNESWHSIDNVYNQCWDVVKDYPAQTAEIASNLMKSFQTYTLQLEDFVQYGNSTLLSTSAAVTLNTLGLLESLKDSPKNLLIQFEQVLPKMSIGFREVVSMQQKNIGTLLADRINDDIKCLECSVKRLLNDFLSNGVANLALGKKTDYEPVMKCLQKLTNKIAQISETALNDASSSIESVEESVLILSIILAHCYVFVQGTESTIAAIVDSERKMAPSTLNSCLVSVDALIVRLTKIIQSITDIGTVTLRTVLKSLVSLSNFLNATFKSVFGFTTATILTVRTVTEGLLSGVSSITQGLNKLG